MAHTAVLPIRPALDEIFQRLSRHDIEWLTTTLNDRYDQLSHEPHRSTILSQQLPVSSVDITLPHLLGPSPVDPYIETFRDHDWSATNLGPMLSWSLEFRRSVNQCLAHKEPAAVLFGPQSLTVYNEAYSDFVGVKHPNALGKSFQDIWPEIPFQDMRSFLDYTRSGAQLSENNVPFMVHRPEFSEERWVSWTAKPVFDGLAHVVGCFINIQDNTLRENFSRRIATLVSVDQDIETVGSTEKFWDEVVSIWARNEIDVPLAAAYSCTAPHHTVLSDTSETGETSSSQTARKWTLAGAVRVRADNDNLVPHELDSTSARELFGAQFDEAMAGSKPVVLHSSAPVLANFLAANESHSIRRAQCRSAVLFPIYYANHDEFHGFVLLGLNPFCRYDAPYQQFIQLLQKQLETCLASVLLVAAGLQDLRLAAKQATEDQIRLQIELARTQQEVIETRSRFRAMVDIAPLAMFHLDETGDILYANQNWIDITQHPANQWGKKSWADAVHHEDKEMVNAEWNRLLEGQSVSFSMRWEGDYAERDVSVDIGGVQLSGPTWTIATAYPELRADGSVKGVVGCLTDISKQKWLEDFQERRMQNALELKRQQENFMDMISHEARNPLSAIMLCAESVLDLFDSMIDGALSAQEFANKSRVLKGIEDAEIILTCAQHQKRMIDDVLTLSKIDSGLLVIEPVEINLVDTISQGLKIFDAELSKHGIDNHFQIHSTYREMSVGTVRLDPNRVLQVLINLIANAIKFTKGEDTRRIDITLSASTARPTQSPSGIEYIARNGEDPGCGPDIVFIELEVQDTGCGISPSEAKRLFQRFQQATPKTHIEYGGSGLGLFISRQLTQMLGGSIGVVGRSNGTTFGFYVSALRCQSRLDLRLDEQLGSAVQMPTTSKKRPIAHNDESIQRKKRSRSHVLVVEDNLVNQRVLRSQLERLQYPVSVANHGLEALDYVAKSRFCNAHGEPLDVILLDVEMPVCTGLECARRIRQMEMEGAVSQHIPIIGVTANARAEQQKAAIDAGMDVVVTKPFRLKELSLKLDEMAARFNEGPG